MNRKFYSALYSIFLAAILLSGAFVHSFENSGKSQTESSISQSSAADQITASTVRPLFAEINFSGFQQIIVHTFQGFEKNSTTFLRISEAQFLVKWKSAIRRTILMEPGLPVSKIIFPFHFFW